MTPEQAETNGKPVALLGRLAVRKLVALSRPLSARERAAILARAVHERIMTRIGADRVLIALALDALLSTTSAAQRQRHP